MPAMFQALQAIGKYVGRNALGRIGQLAIGAFAVQ